MTSCSRPYRRGAVILAAALCLVLAGCGSKITKENADKIKPGMTEKEVSDILGAPTESAEANLPDVGKGAGVPGMPEMPQGMPAAPKGGKSAVWKDGNRVIGIIFVDGKVNAKTTSGL
jgi:hypothetical protein